MMPLIDVVVPCYNYGRFLTASVRSILEQDHVGVRILIIDDASTDETPEVAEGLARHDRRVTYRRHAENRGHIATYNEGLLEWASAEYSLLISADDVLAPGALARAAAVMDRHPDVGLAYGLARYIWDDEDPALIAEDASAEYRIVPPETFLRRCFEHGNVVSTPTAVVRTAVQQDLGGYSPEFPHAGDMEMWMRFAGRGPVAVLKAVQAFYRWHSVNMSSPYRANQLRDKAEVARVCGRMAERLRNAFPQCPSWLAATQRRLGEEAFWLASIAFDLGDKPAYQEYLEYAASVHPGIRHSAMWRKLQLKAFLGVAAWAQLRPQIDRLRGVSARSATLWTPPQRHQTFGWWPEQSDGLEAMTPEGNYPSAAA
jgi:GT2 family glycosyltransferase